MHTIKEVNLELDAFDSTDAGRLWLDENPLFLGRIAAFVDAEQTFQLPESVFQDNLGLGGNSSVVRVVDGAAVKISTPTTGRRGSGVENLMRQYIVMDMLDEHLQSHPGSGVTVPSQLFALRTPAGNYIRAEQYMAGWKGLYGVIAKRRIGVTGEAAINDAILTRVRNAVGLSAARLGLNDLGLGRGDYLHSRNVLVPETADDLAESEICIIDQPQPGFRGAIAARVLQQARSRR